MRALLQFEVHAAYKHWATGEEGCAVDGRRPRSVHDGGGKSRGLEEWQVSAALRPGGLGGDTRGSIGHGAGSINLRPIKEMITVEVTTTGQGYPSCRGITPPRPPVRRDLRLLGIRSLVGDKGHVHETADVITKVLYDKHFHGKSLAKLNTKCKLCSSVRDSQQHILRECSVPVMVRCRRQQETARLHTKV